MKLLPSTLIILACGVIGLFAEEENQAPPEAMQKLQWMVGHWTHNSEGVVMNMSAKWSEGRRFLLREFSIKLGSTPEIRVRQTLYWDPVSKELRSWGCSSDGSFESGVWKVDGNRVSNERSITYPSGEQGKATNTWESTDSKQCVMTSAKRRIKGQNMPDIAPTVLERGE